MLKSMFKILIIEVHEEFERNQTLTRRMITHKTAIKGQHEYNTFSQWLDLVYFKIIIPLIWVHN